MNERAAIFAHVDARVRWCWLGIAVALVALGLAGLLDGLSRRVEIVALLFASLLGLPHGAIDHHVARDVYAARAGWFVRFAATYLAIALAIMLLWWWQAAVAFVAFLLVSVLHFGEAHFGAGQGGLHAHDEGAPQRMLRTIAFGGVTIVTPWMMFPDEVGILFGWITDTRSAHWQQIGAHPLFIAVFVVLVAAGLWMSRGPKSQTAGPPLCLEFAAIVMLFATIKPLLAFSVYFALLHAPRHTLALAERLRKGDWAKDVSWVLMQALPLTLLTLLIAGVWYFAQFQESAWAATSAAMSLENTEKIIRIVFAVLAALTFPHMYYTWRWHVRHARSAP